MKILFQRLIEIAQEEPIEVATFGVIVLGGIAIMVLVISDARDRLSRERPSEGPR